MSLNLVVRFEISSSNLLESDFLLSAVRVVLVSELLGESVCPSSAALQVLRFVEGGYLVGIQLDSMQVHHMAGLLVLGVLLLLLLGPTVPLLLHLHRLLLQE